MRCIGRTDDLLIVRGVNLFPTALREVVAGFRPRVGGPVLIRPAHAGVRQDAAPRVLVELAEGAAADDELAGAIGQAIRAKLVVATQVELVPYGTLAAERVQEQARGLLGGGRYAVTPNSDGSRSVPLITSSGEPSGSSRPLRMPK